LSGFALLATAVIIAVIAVVGTIGYTQFKNRAALKTSTQSIPQPTPVSDETADWKTYTNSKFNYSFKFPNDFNFNSHTFPEDNVVYSLDAQFEQNDQQTGSLIKGVSIGSVVYKQGEDLERYEQGTIIDNSIISNLQLTGESTASAYIQEGIEESITIVIDNKNGKDDFRVMLWCSGDNLRCRQILPQLLSTFKFTE